MLSVQRTEGNGSNTLLQASMATLDCYRKRAYVLFQYPWSAFKFLKFIHHVSMLLYHYCIYVLSEEHHLLTLTWCTHTWQSNPTRPNPCQSLMSIPEVNSLSVSVSQKTKRLALSSLNKPLTDLLLGHAVLRDSSRVSKKTISHHVLKFFNLTYGA